MQAQGWMSPLSDFLSVNTLHITTSVSTVVAEMSGQQAEYGLTALILAAIWFGV